MTATLTTVNAITKEIYEGTIRDQLHSESVGLKRIEGTSEGVEETAGGKYVTFPLRVRRNHGIGSRNENELLPTPGQQGYVDARIGLKYAYGGVKMTGQAIKLVNKNYQAFASAMDREMKGLKEDLKKDQNRQFYGTTVGTLAKVSAASVAGNTFQVAAGTGAKHLEVGMQIDIVTSATNSAVVASNRQITAINKATGVITFDGAAVATAVDNVITRTGSYNREIHGLESIVTATGALFNVDPATEPVWSAVVNNNGGTNRPLSEGLMITMTDDIRTNGGDVSLILAGLGVRRAYFNLLSQQRRYPSTTEFEGGFKGLAFSNGKEIPVIDDLDAPNNKMYFLTEDKLKVYRPEDWSWMDDDGSIWKWVTGYDAYEARMVKYWELGTDQRNAHGVLTDITEG